VITVRSAGAEDVRDNSVHCFILMYTCGLTVVIKRICYVTLCYVMLIDFLGADTGGVQVFGGRCLGGGGICPVYGYVVYFWRTSSANFTHTAKELASSVGVAALCRMLAG